MKQLWGGETSWEERGHERRHHWMGEMLLLEAEMVAQPSPVQQQTREEEGGDNFERKDFRA